MKKKEHEEIKVKQKMSLFERTFWITIGIIFIIWVVVQVMAYNNPKNHSNEIPTLEKVVKVIVQYVDDNRTKINLEKNAEKIANSLNENKIQLNETIIKNVNSLFEPLNAKVDDFLDFHYSVKGEYIELGTALTGDIEQLIQKKIFGNDFNSNLQKVTRKLSNELEKQLLKQQQGIKSIAIEGIDVKLNNDLLGKISTHIQNNKDVQITKLSTIAGTGIAIKMISKQLSKKAGTKIITKGVGKLATKGAASTAAATVGLACGPGAVICSPILAIAAWFGTDAIVASVDEHFTRDDLEREIKNSLNEQKEKMIEKMVEVSNQLLETNSMNTVKIYKNISVKKEVRKTVEELVYNNNKN